MNYPVFIFHELVLRFAEVNQKVGRYLSSTIQENEYMIRTTAGKIRVALPFLEKQYYNPSLISKEEVFHLADGFELDYH